MKRILSLALIIAAGTIAGSGLFAHQAHAAYDCRVTNATFNPGLNKETHTLDENLSAGQRFFLDDNPPTVTITVVTENCMNQDVYVSLREVSGFAGTGNILTSDAVSDLSLKKYTVPESNTFSITTQAGETSCAQNVNDPDCKYVLVVAPSTGLLDPNGYYSRGKPKGMLIYECNGACDESWKILSDTSVGGQQNSVTLDSGAMATDPATTCTDESGNPIAGCYKLYDGLVSILDKLGQKVTVVTGAESLGGFLNGVIALIIGIGGISTLIMIMYYGYQYGFARKSGKPGEMDAAKEGIFKAVIGFLVILSVYVILNTINPDMLRLVPNINYAQLDQDEAGDGMEQDAATSDVSTTGAVPKSCPAGLAKYKTFIVCKTIYGKFKNMIDDAQADNVILGGGGYRSNQQQIALRIKNCGGNTDFNIFQKPAKQCVPPTAKPGTSRHEAGLAFDFTCNGNGIINVGARPATAVCFNWLQAHALKYGFKNLPSENWHWSIDGR